MVNWDLIIAVCGLLIALSASIATIWQGKLTREHNRLSVTPILAIEGTVVLNQPAAIVLKNTGLGPAILHSYIISVDGKPISSGAFSPRSEAIHLIGLDTFPWRGWSFSQSDTLANGDSRSLFEILDPVTDPRSIDRIKLAFNRLSLEIKYTSIYGEQHEVEAHNIMAP